MSPLIQWCGLKSIVLFWDYTLPDVTTDTVVWIEILRPLWSYISFRVTTDTVVWIEIQG